MRVQRLLRNMEILAEQAGLLSDDFAEACYAIDEAAGDILGPWLVQACERTDDPIGTFRGLLLIAELYSERVRDWNGDIVWRWPAKAMRALVESARTR